ncbi:MAG: GNAT family N-acetyltransferase [Armatimonadota bacterium]|nr:GNAT family N-acetyltransferase [Armatimonadota bacterium]
MSVDYELTDFAQVPDLVPQVTSLTNAAFAEYEGAMEVSEQWTDWYLQRPGTDPKLCQAALDDGKLVSQVIVCQQDLQLGGELLRCGIVDSVATEPGHRRRGLARALMERAHEAMQEADIDAAVLYTNPEDHPYRFYLRLGYRERARAAMLVGPWPAESGCGALPVDAAEHRAGLCDLLNEYYVGHEGYSPGCRELWRWHKLEAPSPPTVVAELTGAGPASTASFARASVRIGGRQHTVSLAYDIAAEVMNPEQYGGLLSTAPRETVALLLDEDSPERRWADDLGFEPQIAEVSMVLPLGREASLALQERSGPWYVMVESVVGV